jgi:hypothetical protein
MVNAGSVHSDLPQEVKIPALEPIVHSDLPQEAKIPATGPIVHFSCRQEQRRRLGGVGRRF